MTRQRLTPQEHEQTLEAAQKQLAQRRKQRAPRQAALRARKVQWEAFTAGQPAGA